MRKNLFTLLAALSCSVVFSQTVAFWDFNSTTNDATTSTGSALPSQGSGTLTNIGGVTNSFSAGTLTDPNTTDNSGYNSTNYPAQGLNSKTAGIQIDFSTVGLTNILFEFEQRMSNTAANTYVLQYTLDRTVTTPVWQDAQTFTFVPGTTTGSVWYQRNFNFTSITGINNNPNVAVRIVSAFDPTSGTYLASASTSTYGGGGTCRYDLIKISSLPSIQPYTLAFLRADRSVDENSGTAKVWLKVTAAGNTAGSVSLSVSAASNLTASTDYSISSLTIPVSDTLVVNDTIALEVNLTDDAIAESDEYLIFKIGNGTNVNFSATAQHTLYVKDNDRTIPVANNSLQLNLLNSFNNGPFASNSAEISAYDELSKRIFTANSIASKLEIVDFRNPQAPILKTSLDISSYGSINSVAVKNGIVALAIENSLNKQDSGKVVFLDTNGVFIKQVTVGVMPDMIAFNHAGNKVYTTNEGEPNDSYTLDPEGSISIVDITNGLQNLTGANVTHITFTSFNGNESALKAQGIRIYGLNASASKDFEPEYITISDDDTKAWVTLQENNALAELDLLTNTIIRLIPLGFKNHNAIGNGLDASDVTSGINFSNYPVKGMYLPDAIGHYSANGNIYLLTANEGDARAYTGFNEETSIGNASYVLDATVFPNAADLKNNSVLGKLKTTNKLGDLDNDGDFDEIYVYGARSFTIWDAATAANIYDSGDEFERITANHPQYGNLFNASNGTSIAKKNRSDDKGPEPEGVATGTINGRTYAFIALERVGGVMIYDVTNPNAPQYVTYSNNRGPDRGAEGIIFISANESPNGKNLLVLSNETSSTLTIFEISPCTQPGLANFNSLATQFCSGDSVKLYSTVQSNQNTYQWLLNDTLINTAQDSVFYANTSGNYALYAFNATGCEDKSTSLSLQEIANPVEGIVSGSPLSFCSGDSVVLSHSYNSNYTYQWINNSGIINGETDTTLLVNQSGNYALVVFNQGICSDTTSFSTINVYVSPSIPTINVLGADLTCSVNAASYQWFLNGNSINGANNQTYSVTQNGNYSVEITDANGCTALSSDYSFNTVSINSVNEQNTISIYPNPTTGIVKINSSNDDLIQSVVVVDLNGKIVNEFTVAKKLNSEISISLDENLSNGIYWVRVISNNSIKNYRVALSK